ncbi:MAG TPA: phosphohistidine phosphatase SixA [Solirubrobacteraceae bacterium]|jgi:phosphohistidine phosphatase|nr:phosphohistidine phosphatase SixA [Solirubrobacteraceae bacterium]
MARQLWLLRHADAEPHGTRADFERRLTPRGERQARLAGVALARTGVSFDAIFVSPKVRAQQTAELALQEWGEERGEERLSLLRTYAPLAGGFDAAQALDALAGTDADARVLLVGHEPDLSGVLAELTGARIDLKKGGLAVVRLDGGGGELVILLRPRELALIANLATADV